MTRNKVIRYSWILGVACAVILTTIQALASGLAKKSVEKDLGRGVVPDPKTEDPLVRKKNFLEHQKEQEIFEQERMSKQEDYVLQRSREEKEREKLLELYLSERPRSQDDLPEKDRPGFEEYSEREQKWLLEKEEALQEYLKAKSFLTSDQKKILNHVEILEYDLQDKEKLRIPLAERTAKKGTGGSGLGRPGLPNAGSGSQGAAGANPNFNPSGGAAGGNPGAMRHSPGNDEEDDTDFEDIPPPPPPPPPMPPQGGNDFIPPGADF